MMDCLKDYIGLAGCGVSNPASGLFINSLPGISLKSVDALADSEQANYIGVWNDVQVRAIKRVELAVISHMAKQIKVKTNKYQTSTHYVAGNNGTITGNTAEIVIKSDCYSVMSVHRLEQIKFSGTAITATISFYNDDTGEQLGSSVTINTGTSAYADINRQFYCANLRILIVKTSGNFQDTTASAIYHDCGSIQFGYKDNTTGNFMANGNSYGFNLIGYSNGCDSANLICENRSLFANALWYLLGSEMMMERMASNRVNFWTMDRKQAEELKAYFDVEAEKSIQMSLNGVTWADCDCCIECDPPIAIREARF